MNKLNDVLKFSFLLMTTMLMMCLSTPKVAANDWEALDQECEKALQGGEFGKAEVLARKIIASSQGQTAILQIPFARTLLIRALYNENKNYEALQQTTVGLQESDKLLQFKDEDMKSTGKVMKRGFFMQRGIILAREKKLSEAQKEFQAGLALGPDNDRPYASFLEYFAGLRHLQGNTAESDRLWQLAEKIKNSHGGNLASLPDIVDEMSPTESTIELNANTFTEIQKHLEQVTTKKPIQIAEVRNSIATLNMQKLIGWQAYVANTDKSKQDGTLIKQVIFRNEQLKQEISINSITPRLGYGPKLEAHTVEEITQKIGLAPKFSSVDHTGSLPLGKNSLYYYTGTVDLGKGALVKGFVGCTETGTKTFMLYGFDFSGQSDYRLAPTKNFIAAIKNI